MAPAELLSQVELQGESVSCLFRVSARSRRIRLTVREDGALVLTIPRFVSRRVAEAFLVEKAEWVLQHLQRIQAEQRLVVPDDPRRYRDYKEKARRLVRQRLEYYNQFYGFSYGQVAIRNQKSRWGSCSTQGNLNFNYRIVFLAPELADYIVVHELCHLKEMNHSADFWQLVALTLPEFKNYRKEIARQGIRFV